MILSPTDALSNWYAAHPPKCAFTGETPEDVAAWQRDLRAKLAEISGLKKMEAWRCEPEVTADEPVDAGDHIRQRLLLRTAPDYLMPLYVLTPKADGPFTPLLALHGHGKGKSDVCGLPESEKAAARIRELNYDYALQAVRKGYIVFAPDKRGFGEASLGEKDICLGQATCAILMGMSVIGAHTWDNMRLLDHIATRDDVRPGPVGCIGLSGGGGGTMWLAAMDERIGAAVNSGHCAVFEDGQFGHICNVVPGLLEWADRGEISALTAPRALLIETSDADQWYSRERALAAFRVAENVYTTAGVRDRLDIDEFPGRHEWSGRKAWDFLAANGLNVQVTATEAERRTSNIEH